LAEKTIADKSIKYNSFAFIVLIKRYLKFFFFCSNISTAKSYLVRILSPLPEELLLLEEPEEELPPELLVLDEELEEELTLDPLPEEEPLE